MGWSPSQGQAPGARSPPRGPETPILAVVVTVGGRSRGPESPSPGGPPHTAPGAHPNPSPSVSGHAPWKRREEAATAEKEPKSYWSRHYIVDLLAVVVPAVPTVAWLCRFPAAPGPAHLQHQLPAGLLHRGLALHPRTAAAAEPSGPERRWHNSWRQLPALRGRAGPGRGSHGPTTDSATSSHTFPWGIIWLL